MKKKPALVRGFFSGSISFFDEALASSFSRPWEGPATFRGGLFRLNFRDDPGHELRGYFGMRFGCEVDTVEAVVVVRKNGIEDDNRDRRLRR